MFVGKNRLVETGQDEDFSQLTAGVEVILYPHVLKAPGTIRLSRGITKQMLRTFGLSTDETDDVSDLSPIQAAWRVAHLRDAIRLVVLRFTGEELPTHRGNDHSDTIYLTALREAQKQLLLLSN